MIKESYCSFEVSKLLKEKGFDEKCSHYWQNEISEYSIPKEIYKWTDNAFANTEINDSERFSAPTHQMVLKWLREVHKIFIEPFVSIDLNGKYHYSFRLLNSICKDILEPKDLVRIDFKDTYEEVIEVAIEYTLENLI